MLKHKNILFSLVVAMTLAGCAGEDKYEERPAKDLYKQGVKNYESGNYTKAAKTFLEVERQHPYSDHSVEAQLMAAVAYYEGKKYDDAIEGFRVFIQLHPGHKKIPYAYYMLGLCHYEQIPVVERDQEATEKAEKAFLEVMERFPGNKYAKDAKLKLDLVYDHLAGREMTVGRYYQDVGNHLAAVNRFKTVASNYQTTSHVPEALHRMVESYLALGIRDQAASTAAVLGHNYPGSQWYKDAHALLTPGKSAPKTVAKRKAKPSKKAKSLRTKATPAAKKVDPRKVGLQRAESEVASNTA